MRQAEIYRKDILAGILTDEGNAKEDDGTTIKIAIRCDFYVLLWQFIVHYT